MIIFHRDNSLTLYPLLYFEYFINEIYSINENSLQRKLCLKKMKYT
jgi:hypothetical protein